MMKARERNEMLKVFGRDTTVKVLSELEATKPREALRYLRWLADLEGWPKPRRVRQRMSPKRRGAVGREKI